MAALAQIAILARFLDAEAFGLYASITAVTVLFSTLATSAFPDYLVVTDDEDGHVRSTLYFLSAGLTALIFTAYFAAAPILSHWLNDGTTKDLLRVSALQILTAGFSENFRASLRKRMHFRPVTIAGIAGTIFGAVSSFVLVAFVQDARALIYSWVLNNLLMAGILAWAAWRHDVLPRRIFDSRQIRPFLALGRWRVLSYVFNALNSRFDVLLISWVLGTSASGVYFLASRIVVQPLSRVTPIITQLALPVFADIGHDRRMMQKAYRRASQLTALILAPLILGLIVIFPLINELILGEGWEEVSDVVQILAVLVLVRVFTPLTGAIMLALKDFTWPLRWQIVLFLITIPSVLVVSHFNPSIYSLAFTVVFVQSAILLIMYVRFLRLFEVPCVRENVMDIVGPLSLGIVMAALLVGARSYLMELLPDLPTAGILVIIGAAIYGACAIFLLKRHTEILREVVFR